MEAIRKIGGDVPAAEQMLDPKRQVIATFIAGVRCVQRGELPMLGMGNPLDGPVTAITAENASGVLGKMEERFGAAYPDLFPAAEASV